MSRVEGRGAERARELMMAALDGELDAAGRAELERLLVKDAAVREEWESLQRVKEVTGFMTLRPAPDEVWKDYWTSVYSRVERGVGWVLLSIGAIVLLSYGVWTGLEGLLTETTLPWLVKAGIIVGSVGLVVLVVSVVREKLFLGFRQRYKDIER